METWSVEDVSASLEHFDPGGHHQHVEVHVGETRRTLRVRMAECRRVVKNKDPKNGIAVHVQKTAHTINWQEAKIFEREVNW